jgi:hypothetical protein
MRSQRARRVCVSHDRARRLIVGLLRGGYDELADGIAAHAVDSAAGASADSVGVAAGTLGGNLDRAISAPHDNTFVIEGAGFAEVDNKSSPRRTAHKGDGGADFNAESLVGFSVGNARLRRSIRAPAASNVNGAGRGIGAARVRCGTNAGGVGSRTDIIFSFRLSVLAKA